MELLVLVVGPLKGERGGNGGGTGGKLGDAELQQDKIWW